MNRSSLRVPTILALALLPPAAFAHTGFTAGLPAFAAGVLHPFTGLDHLLAMIAVGLWAAQLGGRAAWLLPALFPALMTAGAAAALTGIAVPAVEPAIAISVIALGALIGAGIRLPTLACALLVGLFATVHGYAHGAELPPSADMAGYAAGFIGATVFLHLSGLFLGLWSQRSRRGLIAKIGGSAIAASGIALLLT